MPTITVRLNEEEQKAFNEYAKLHEIPLSTLFKLALEEKMENDIDLKQIKMYEANLQNREVETVDHDTVMKTFNLQNEI